MGSCIGCCCYSVCCCECNFAIFPAPSPSYTNESNPFVHIFENSVHLIDEHRGATKYRIWSSFARNQR